MSPPPFSAARRNGSVVPRTAAPERRPPPEPPPRSRLRIAPRIVLPPDGFFRFHNIRCTDREKRCAPKMRTLGVQYIPYGRSKETEIVKRPPPSSSSIHARRSPRRRARRRCASHLLPADEIFTRNVVGDAPASTSSRCSRPRWVPRYAPRTMKRIASATLRRDARHGAFLGAGPAANPKIRIVETGAPSPITGARSRDVNPQPGLPRNAILRRGDREALSRRGPGGPASGATRTRSPPAVGAGRVRPAAATFGAEHRHLPHV